MFLSSGRRSEPSTVFALCSGSGFLIKVQRIRLSTGCHLCEP
ncbi:PEP-CTERM sorting domain-containing protein [Oceaniovalibus sp. ACAM 378]|nr:PEP-CTERM sorting domain-containing protein [Oceaniovalibus sp. ACAM 378]